MMMVPDLGEKLEEAGREEESIPWYVHISPVAAARYGGGTVTNRPIT